ncbi:MAG: DNA polymerase III subunit delta' [Methylophilaceae bacterium]|nr:DNA polymerase III subunit delta' [Methylophilaceae bacterium]
MNSSNSLYPWQQPTWQRIRTMRSKLPHALLISGKAGIGKLEFAQNLAKSLLCIHLESAGAACNLCSNCTWFNEGTHPDFRLINPDQDTDNVTDEAPSTKKTAKKSVVIKIEQIRELNQFLALSNHQHNGLRIVLMCPAEALNLASANALLKMLEEPPQSTIFLLVSHQPQRLLPTIISRCQVVDMPMPSESEAVDWLKNQGVKHATSQLSYAGGSPLLALKQAEEGAWISLAQSLSAGVKLNPFTSAPLFLGASLSASMDFALTALQKWCCDLLSYKLSEQVRYHVEYTSALQALSKSVNLNLLLDFNTELIYAKKMANHPLNNELQLENILLRYTQLFDIKR